MNSKLQLSLSNFVRVTNLEDQHKTKLHIDVSPWKNKHPMLQTSEMAYIAQSKVILTCAEAHDSILKLRDFTFLTIHTDQLTTPY